MADAIENEIKDFIARAREGKDDLFVVKVSALEELQHLARDEMSKDGSNVAEAYLSGYIHALDHILEVAYDMRNKAKRKGHANGVGFAWSP